MNSDSSTTLTSQAVQPQADDSWTTLYRSTLFAKLGSAFAAPINIETTPAVIVGVASAVGFFSRYPRIGASCTINAIALLVGVHAGSSIFFHHLGYWPLYQIADKPMLDVSADYVISGSDLGSLLEYKEREEAREAAARLANKAGSKT